ncbi:MAG TPA: ABC transporter ATP-binding protein [Terriglobia bacterium]|nr:ABC transporter ATP-binding protein [Terriglobia bacterium]
MAFVELSNVTKSFPLANYTRREVLTGVNLAVDEGEFVSVVGFTGAGKTTLLNILAGLIEPDEGSVVIEGKPLSGTHPKAALVFQNYSLLPWFSALENVRLAVGAAFPEWSRARQVEQAKRYLETVGLGRAMARKPSQLSGGMRQRVAIARAFAMEPSILFLDEPFSALDALTRGTLQQELSQLCNEAGRPVTVVMITNNLDEALLLSDRIVPMTRGPRARLGAPINVKLDRPRSPDALLRDPAAIRIRSEIVEFLSDFVQRKPARPAVTPDAQALDSVAEGAS